MNVQHKMNAGKNQTTNSTLDLFAEELTSTAIFSNDHAYRYLLSRKTGTGGKTITFIGLNPSVADQTKNDPTIRRCLDFSSRWGGTQLFMVNLFGYVSTNPQALFDVEDPVGHENDKWLEYAISKSDMVIAAWGKLGVISRRGDEVKNRYGNVLLVLKINKDGSPAHPLYIKSTTIPFVWSK